ncbi:MAG: hypothetical protein AAGA46_03910 [Cyanobacteria bacterium P01_F01_bin.13]
MQRLLLVLLITTGAISLSGCGFFNRNSDDVVEEPTTLTEEQPVETAGGKLPGLPEGEGSENVVEVSATSPTVIARDLIQSTDPNERAIGVERSRSDPFAELTIPLVPPQPIEIPGSEAAAGGTATPNTSPGGTNGSNADFKTAEDPELEAPPEVNDLPDIAELPEIPQPTTARAVRVSGVIQIAGAPYAIIKAPDEIERYVRQGERIAGGSVVVKRIDTRSPEPRVILVENGIEVERFVTAAQPDAAEEETPPPSDNNTVSSIGTLPALPRPGI